MKVLLSVVGVTLFLGVIIFIVNSSKTSKDAVVENTKNSAESTETTNLTSDQYQDTQDTSVVKKTYVTNLQDVTQGNLYRFTQFTGDSSGKVQVVYSKDTGYELSASFSNLPEPAPEHFYEGWVVTSGKNIDVISTGRAEKDEDGMFVNYFSSDQDLTDHTLYVLTIEPEDQNPKPEEHILEGLLVLQN